MGQTGRRSIATHILAVKIALAAAHFHSFGVSPQGPWNTSVNMPPVDAPNPHWWHHGYCQHVGENKLARRHLYVGRGEQSTGPPLPGGFRQRGAGHTR